MRKRRHAVAVRKGEGRSSARMDIREGVGLARSRPSDPANVATADRSRTDRPSSAGSRRMDPREIPMSDGVARDDINPCGRNAHAAYMRKEGRRAAPRISFFHAHWKL